MGILAQCLRKETLIERFKMKRNDSSKHLFQKKMKEKRSLDVKTSFQDDQISCSAARKKHFVTCMTREDPHYISTLENTFRSTQVP